MKAGSLIASFSVILLANAFALVHVARNRSGAPDAEVTLTDRELRYFSISSQEDDSGVTLNLQRTDAGPYLTFQSPDQGYWFDEQVLRRLGFDCSVNPASADAQRFYQRQRPRRAFVAMEYDGPAWHAWLDAYQRYVDRARSLRPEGAPFSGRDEPSRSHLVAIDADLDATRLRSRHPDRGAIVVLPAVVGINLVLPAPNTVRGGLLRGAIIELPSAIHVPRPFSEEFRRRAKQNLSYNVKLRFGSAFEPEVTGVDFRQ